MSYKIIGQSVERWDAIAKVQGKADYTADLPKKNVLYGKILRATIAHGLVKKLDVSEALKVEGVIKVLTPDDLPDLKFPTAGHPYALDPKLADIADRNILTKRVRLYGDEIAAVIAENELAAEKALEKDTGARALRSPPEACTLQSSQTMKLIHTPADLAINGAAPAFEQPLHVGRPNFGDRDAFLRRVNQILDNQWLTNNGPMVQEFEQRIAEYLGVKHCVAATSR